MLADLKEKIVDLLTEPLQKEGVELAELVLSIYKNNSTLKLFVYSVNTVNVDECARISRKVSDILEETDYFKDGYLLEVSSPGLDRPLKTITDFKYRAGETVKILFVDKSRKKISAEIAGTENSKILLKDENEEFSLDIEEIEQAKIIF